MLYLKWVCGSEIKGKAGGRGLKTALLDGCVNKFDAVGEKYKIPLDFITLLPVARYLIIDNPRALLQMYNYYIFIAI